MSTPVKESKLSPAAELIVKMAQAEFRGRKGGDRDYLRYKTMLGNIRLSTTEFDLAISLVTKALNF